MNVRFLAPAAQELEDAFDWYETFLLDKQD